jgi:hypothetical protein
MDRRLIGLPGYEVERFPHLTCFTPPLKDREGLVAFASLDAKHAQRQIAEQQHYFSLVGIPFRWRVLDLDGGPDIRLALQKQGLATTTRNALMVHTFDRDYPVPKLPRGLRIVHVSQLQDIRDVLAIYSVAFGRSFSHLLPGFSQQIKRDPDTLSLYCVYAGERPVAAAWTEYPRGSQFPELHPEAILPRWNTAQLAQSLTLHRLTEVHLRLYDRAMAVVHPDRIADATALGFKLVTLRYTMRSNEANPWDVAKRREEQINTLKKQVLETETEATSN